MNGHVNRRPRRISGYGPLIERDGGIGVADHECSLSAIGKFRAQAACDGKGHVFFRDLVAESGPSLRAAVAGINHNQKACVRHASGLGQRSRPRAGSYGRIGIAFRGWRVVRGRSGSSRSLRFRGGWRGGQFGGGRDHYDFSLVAEICQQRLGGLDHHLASAFVFRIVQRTDQRIVILPALCCHHQVVAAEGKPQLAALGADARIHRRRERERQAARGAFLQLC